MKRDRVVRDRLIAATMAYADNEDRIRDLSARMREARCASFPPCWIQDERESWKDHEAAIPDTYCEACQQSTILARERHGLKRQRGARKAALLARADEFRGSIYGACAGPVAGSGGGNRLEHRGGVSCCTNSPSTSAN